MLAPRQLALGGAGVIDQLPAQAEAGRPALPVAVLNQAALAGEHLDRKLAAVFAGHLALEHLLDVGAEAAVVLEGLGTILHVDSGPPADEFVVRRLVGILETTPAADVVNENDREIGLSALHVIEQPLEGVAAIETQSALPLVGVGADDFHVAPCRILADGVPLVFRRILLMLGRHPHVLRGPDGVRMWRRRVVGWVSHTARQGLGCS